MAGGGAQSRSDEAEHEPEPAVTSASELKAEADTSDTQAAARKSRKPRHKPVIVKSPDNANQGAAGGWVPCEVSADAKTVCITATSPSRHENAQTATVVRDDGRKNKTPSEPSLTHLSTPDSSHGGKRKANSDDASLETKKVKQRATDEPKKLEEDDAKLEGPIAWL